MISAAFYFELTSVLTAAAVCSIWVVVVGDVVVVVADVVVAAFVVVVGISAAILSCMYNFFMVHKQRKRRFTYFVQEITQLC